MSDGSKHILRKEYDIGEESVLLEGLLQLRLQTASDEPVADQRHGGLVHLLGGDHVRYSAVHDHTFLGIDRHVTDVMDVNVWMFHSTTHRLKVKEYRRPRVHDVRSPVYRYGRVQEAVQGVHPAADLDNCLNCVLQKLCYIYQIKTLTDFAMFCLSLTNM